MKLLVVEDYEPLRRSLTLGLTEAGFAVDATGDGREGLWFAKGGEYDVIVLDLMLPGMDGMSLLKDIRQGGQTSAVLILTAKSAIDDRVSGLNQGADDYLVKPFAFAELLARVHALVRRKHAVSSPVIAVGDLRIDLRAKEIRWEHGGVGQISLTAREFGLIEFLGLHRGQVMSRTQIAQHLYGFDAEPDSNAIDVHVAQLRRKIETPGRPRLIHTRRGLGYVLDDTSPCDP